MAAPTRAYCAFHHQSADLCNPIDPELGDLLPDLIRRGVNIRIVPAPPHVEPCEDCTSARRLNLDDPAGAADAVAYVAHLAPSEALPDGYTYRTALCAEHLEANVLWELRRGCTTWIEINAGGAQ